MTRALTDQHARLLRLRAQCLDARAAPPLTDAAAVVRALCGVQAQETTPAALAIRARSADLTAADVEQARVQERTIVRTWGLRGTLHLLASEDLGWFLALLAPRYIAETQRRYDELGLDENYFIRVPRALRKILADHQALTRAELVEHLAEYGLFAVGQAIPHTLRRAALEGVICHGPLRDGEPTYVLLDDWLQGTVGDELRRMLITLGAAQAKLARRYLAAYGPARPEDLATWAGIPLREAREAFWGLPGELIEVELSSGPAWMLRSRQEWLEPALDSSPPARLLPSYDTYLLGYRNRELLVAPRYARRIHPGGGIIHPTLLAEGRAQGTWKLERERGYVKVAISPFEPLPPTVDAEVAHEIADIGRFLGLAATQSPIATAPKRRAPAVKLDGPTP